MTRPHPIDALSKLNDEQRAIVRLTADAARRARAVDEARVHGPVRVPSYWGTGFGGRIVPQSNAFVSTAWLRLSRMALPELPLADALLASRSLLDDRPPPFAVGGTLVDLGERARAHELATWRDADRASVHAHPMSSAALAPGAPIAVVTASTGEGRARRDSTHVVRAGALHAAGFETVDAAREHAHGLLTTGAATSHLAIVTAPGGASFGVAAVALPPALEGAASDPLVGSIAGTGTTLGWRPATRALRAIVALDGTRWM
ncbi:MAG: hypothetical protein JWM98_2720 [Thermoleophilia bacterium]|nr:hypothetical protein [Thermoleophilia bacterium]